MEVTQHFICSNAMTMQVANNKLLSVEVIIQSLVMNFCVKILPINVARYASMRTIIIVIETVLTEMWDRFT